MTTQHERGTLIFKRKVTIGTVRGLEDYPPLVVTIEYGNVLNPTRLPSLSITGSYGGERHGGGGQCVDTLRNEIVTYAEGWNAKRANELADVWERWHLNGTRAGCEHQRAEDWNKRPIDPDKPLNAYGKHHANQHNATWNMLVWAYPSEVPGGLLTVPCPVCGYKYGTAWLHEDVPADVLEWLKSL